VGTDELLEVKQGIHRNIYLSALELTEPDKKELWNTGQIQDYPKKHACVQGSDAHTPNDIGTRPVYIRMKELGLTALKSTFRNFEGNIFFPDELSLSK